MTKTTKIKEWIFTGYDGRSAIYLYKEQGKEYSYRFEIWQEINQKMVIVHEDWMDGEPTLIEILSEYNRFVTLICFGFLTTYTNTSNK